jgi:hypothetical protein
MAFRALQPTFLPIVRAAMGVVLNTRGQRKFVPHLFRINEAIKVHPLATIIAPRLSAISFFDPGGEYRLFQSLKMFADHQDSPSRWTTGEIGFDHPIGERKNTKVESVSSLLTAK